MRTRSVSAMRLARSQGNSFQALFTLCRGLKKITELPYAQERKSSDRWGRSKCRATGLPCGDIVSQRLALDGLLALGVL